MLVGLSRNITCTTQLNVTRMEWLLDDKRTKLEKRDDGGQTLVLLFTPENIELNGTSFTCRVTTKSGSTFNESIIITIRGGTMRIRDLQATS